MPTPIGLISAADSNIRQGIPAACSASPRVNPPTPAPTIMMSSMSAPGHVCSRRALSGDCRDETRLVSLLSIQGNACNPGAILRTVSVSVPALRSSVKNAAPRPGHEVSVSGLLTKTHPDSGSLVDGLAGEFLGAAP